MRFHVVLRYVAFALLLNSFFMGVATTISFFNNDSAAMPLLYSTLITALFGIFPLIYVPKSGNISNKEGLLVVVISWLSSCLVGSLPYLLWGGVFSFTNAWFESVSGFTTTGSTILVNIEALPDSLLFWRAATHWLGGVGIIIFVLSVLPFMGIAELVLFRSEVSSLAQESFRQRARNAVRILAGVYLGLTILEVIALKLCGMNLFDSIIHSFATIATGGFSNKNSSIAHYNSPVVEIVIMIFMILSGLHFGLLFTAVTGNIKNIFNSTITRFYIISMLVGIIITSLNLYGTNYDSWIDSLRFSSFQLLSLGTSTGFATADSSVWPAFTQLILIFFTFQCACSGSTSGGIKADRIVVLFKSFIRHLKQLMHPNAVIPIRIEGRAVDDKIASRAVSFVIFYIAIVFISTLLLSLLGIDSYSAFTGSAATMGNVGPGFGSVGSVGNYSQIPQLGKWIFSADMLLGRLEIYALFIALTPAQWKKSVSY
ncbi:MAG: hypothetical protein JW995_02625 [Melioribacteraceae bacterium]|nr:hypothetical protein [Melioribacteraceae bacterium]